MNEILNKVSQSGLVTIDPAAYVVKGVRSHIDLKDRLWMELVLKEKDFRDWLKEQDWSVYQDHLVSIDCSADAIIPPWAFMLLASALQPYAAKISMGTAAALEESLYHEAISEMNQEEFRDARIVIKGCGEGELPRSAYVELVNKLQPVAKSVMFGEPCSTVPVYKRKSL